MWVGGGRCDLVLSSRLVKKYTNTANGDPRARKEKGIHLTATIQTVTKDSFMQWWRPCGFEKKLFQRQGMIKDILRLWLAVYCLPFCLALQKVYKTKGRGFIPVEFLTFKDGIFRY